MACLTFVTSFFVLVFQASKTLKLMIVKHFQKFFWWPGDPKMDSKGRSNFVCFVSFFILGPNGVQGGPRRCPRWPKRRPREAKGDPKGVQRNPKGVQGEPRGTKKGSRGSPGRARWQEGLRQLDTPYNSIENISQM